MASKHDRTAAIASGVFSVNLESFITPVGIALSTLYGG